MKTPFGSTAAAIKLAAMVENDKRLRRIVSRYFTTYLQMLSEVTSIHDRKSKHRALLIFREYYFDSVKNDPVLPQEVKTHLLNAMTAYHRGVQLAIKLLYDNKSSV